jgi:hypothetical protein
LPLARWIANVTSQVGLPGVKWSLGTASVTHVNRLSGQGASLTNVQAAEPGEADGPGEAAADGEGSGLAAGDGLAAAGVGDGDEAGADGDGPGLAEGARVARAPCAAGGMVQLGGALEPQAATSSAQAPTSPAATTR